MTPATERAMQLRRWRAVRETVAWIALTVTTVFLFFGLVLFIQAFA